MAVTTEVGFLVVEISSFCEESTDMNRLATCNKIDPKTCFETSKNHTFRGRGGVSRHRFHTSDSNARIPRAACTNIAKGPNSRHSPSFAPGISICVDSASPSLVFVVLSCLCLTCSLDTSTVSKTANRISH